MCRGLVWSPEAMQARANLGVATNPNTREVPAEEIERIRAIYWVERLICQTRLLGDLQVPLTREQVDRVEAAWQAVVTDLGVE